MQILFPPFALEVVELLTANNIQHCIDGNSIVFPKHNLRMLPIPLQNNRAADAGGYTAEETAGRFYLYEDRWRSSKSASGARLLSKLGIFRRIHARLCQTVSLHNCRQYGMTPEEFSKKTKRFLDTFHTYGYLKAQTDYLLVYRDNVVAAAQFMQTYKPGNQEENSSRANISAYEWTRYASLPDTRVAGGMGKILKYFISDIQTDAKKLHLKSSGGERLADKESLRRIEIMSYSDNELGDGDSYRRLGFMQDGFIPPTTYRIDTVSWKRINPREWALLCRNLTEKEALSYPTIQNCGSLKWKLLIG